MTTAEIGVFGGSGFYSFLEDTETVDIDTPYGTPSAPPVIGEVGGRAGGVHPASRRCTTSSRRTGSRTARTCGR